MIGLNRKLITLLLSVIALTPCLSGQEKCEELKKELDKTYGFLRSKVSDKEFVIKFGDMDKIWNKVRENRTLIPCIEDAVTSPNAGPTLKQDGAWMLMNIEPNKRHEEIMLKALTSVPLKEVWNYEQWVRSLLDLNHLGYDITQGADIWLRDPNAQWMDKSVHANLFDYELVSICLYGSMDEPQAINALTAALNDEKHPGREQAALILIWMGTPKSWSALHAANLKGLSEQAINFITEVTEKGTPDILAFPMGIPIYDREQFLAEIDRVSTWQSVSPIAVMLKEDPLLTHHAVMVLKPEDLQRFDKVRTTIANACIPDTLEYWKFFGGIIMSVNWLRDHPMPPLKTN